MIYPTTTEITGQARIPSKPDTKKLHSGQCGVILLTAKIDETPRHHRILEKENHA
jgi:hypothetical protein